jgi:hypothetical protein
MNSLINFIKDYQLVQKLMGDRRKDGDLISLHGSFRKECRLKMKTFCKGTVTVIITNQPTNQLRGARTPLFITAFTTARHRSLFRASRIQSTSPQPVYLRSILIPSSHLRLGHLSDLLPSGFLTKTLHTFLSSPIRVTCLAHLIRLDLIYLMISGDK